MATVAASYYRSQYLRFKPSLPPEQTLLAHSGIRHHERDDGWDLAVRHKERDMIKTGKWPVPSKDTIALKRFAARLRKESRAEEAKLAIRASHYVWSMHSILRCEAGFIRI